jgi:predicted AAA+ superfamily ATPase
MLLQGEDLQVAELLQKRTVANYKQLTAGKKIIVIDEAQAIPEIGKILKLLIDSVKGITVIATGSSSFDLVYTTGEPLVGRNLVYHLYPIAQAELSVNEDYLATIRNLEERLIYGSYPELWHLNSAQERENYLKQLVSSYLLKDLLTMENVKGADVLYKLLQMLAWQVGSQVSTVELAGSLQLNKGTVERYLDLLSKVFIIYPLTGYSNNLRKEISKSKKWYFFDNGIRNALIGNFSPLQQRNDIGQLWEQYVLSERIKYNSYRHYQPQYFFWRTYDGQEIDFLELYNGNLQALECKWKDGKVKTPIAFAKAYPDAKFSIINKDTYLDWITDLQAK